MERVKTNLKPTARKGEKPLGFEPSEFTTEDTNSTERRDEYRARGQALRGPEGGQPGIRKSSPRASRDPLIAQWGA
jgi:hypothetical protein